MRRERAEGGLSLACTDASRRVNMYHFENLVRPLCSKSTGFLVFAALHIMLIARWRATRLGLGTPAARIRHSCASATMKLLCQKY